MTMLLIITPNNEESSNSVEVYARQLGWAVHKASPTGRIPAILQGLPGTVYGEPIFCEIVAAQMGWHLHKNDIHWITTLPKPFVKRNIVVSDVKFARTIRTPKFIAPIDCGLFVPKVYQSGSDLPVVHSIEDSKVIISDIVDFRSEYRAFIKGREVVAVCCTKYLKRATRQVNWNEHGDVVATFVNSLLRDRDVACAPGTVIDVGMTYSGSMLIIKSSPAWTTKLHGCEPAAALDVMRDSCEMLN
jgi:hypothetical protein